MPVLQLDPEAGSQNKTVPKQAMSGLGWVVLLL
jgi:hypothetical protein